MSNASKPASTAQSVHSERRRFIGGAVALAGVAIAPGLLLFETAHGATRSQDATHPQIASSAVRWGLLVDTTLCTEGCTACVDACRKENGLPVPKGPTDAQWVRKVELVDPDSGLKHYLPMMCQHCGNPPCVEVCPTGASFKRADGLVLVDRHWCIGCRYCMMACPYKARSFVAHNVTGQRPDVPRGIGTVGGCTMCVQRIDRNEQPACVVACRMAAKGAMTFGNLNDHDSEIARRIRERTSIQVRADLGLDPAVRYQGI